MKMCSMMCHAVYVLNGIVGPRAELPLWICEFEYGVNNEDAKNELK